MSPPYTARGECLTAAYLGWPSNEKQKASQPSSGCCWVQPDSTSQGPTASSSLDPVEEEDPNLAAPPFAGCRVVDHGVRGVVHEVKPRVLRPGSHRSDGGQGSVASRWMARCTFRRVMVGREPERRLLAALLEGARAGSAGTLVVRGEPGVGKTALLNEFVADAGGATVLRTQGLEVEAPLAFAALRRLLRPGHQAAQGTARTSGEGLAGRVRRGGRCVGANRFWWG